MTLTFATTSFAIPRGSPFCGNLLPRVFGGVFMPSFTMCSGLLSFSICQPANRKAVQNAKHFGGQHFFNWVALVKPSEQSVDMYAKALRPLPSSQRYAVFGDSDVNFSIVRLLFAGRPSAIFRAVRPVIIDAIKSSSGWSLAHVSNKIRKRHPSFANVNASSPISFIRRVFRIRTTLFGGLPYGVQIGLGSAMTTLHGASVLQWSRKIK